MIDKCPAKNHCICKDEIIMVYVRRNFHRNEKHFEDTLGGRDEEVSIGICIGMANEDDL